MNHQYTHSPRTTSTPTGVVRLNSCRRIRGNSDRPAPDHQARCARQRRRTREPRFEFRPHGPRTRLVCASVASSTFRCWTQLLRVQVMTVRSDAEVAP